MTVRFPDLKLKWQLKNDGEASSLSKLLATAPQHDTWYHCLCFVAYVHQNSSIGTLYTTEHMDEEVHSYR